MLQLVIQSTLGPTHLPGLPSDPVSMSGPTLPWYLGSLPIEWEHSKWEAGQTYASSEAHGPQPGILPREREMMVKIQSSITVVGT